MLQLSLKSSWIEFTFVCACHLSALLAISSIALANDLLLLLGLWVLYSLFTYGLGYFGNKRFISRLMAGHENFIHIHSVVIGQQHALLRRGSKSFTVGLPKITYYSEFLLVLRFSPERPARSTQSGFRLGAMLQPLARDVTLVVWPDSLSKAEGRHLRRYLRFECPRVLV